MKPDEACKVPPHTIYWEKIANINNFNAIKGNI